MTALIRRFSQRPRALVVPLILIAAIAVAGLSLAAAAKPDARTVSLVARDMAFYLPGDGTPNPTLRLAAGERARLTLVNDEPGMQHDLAVEAAGFAIGPLPVAAGSHESALLIAPEEPGLHPYVCTLHARMMRGTLEVVAAGR